MIFLTVGTQLGFPRLTQAMNRYAEILDEEIVAQVGDGTEDLPNLTRRKMIPPLEFDATFQRARVIVSHAGVGTILSAKRFNRPLIIVPRRHDLGEHRNAHQMATARALLGTPGIHVAWQVDDLLPLLQEPELAAAQQALGLRHSALLDGINRFIRSTRASAAGSKAAASSEAAKG